MKKFALYFTALFAIATFAGCKKEGAYPGGTVSPYISMYDLRDLFKGQEVTLTKDNMFVGSPGTELEFAL